MIKITITHCNPTGPIEFPAKTEHLDYPDMKSMTNEDAQQRVDAWIQRNNRRLVSWDKDVIKDKPNEQSPR